MVARVWAAHWWMERGGRGLLFVGRLVALACASGAGARRGSRPEITAGRCCACGGCGRKGKDRQVGSGGQRGRRALWARGERAEAGLRRGPCGAGSRELAWAALAGRAGVASWAQERSGGLRVWVVGLGWGFGFGLWVPFSISFSFLFLIQTKFEFKYKFEFKPHSNN